VLNHTLWVLVLSRIAIADERAAPISGKPYQATTINRILATIKHFANWIVARFPIKRQLTLPVN
jgi:hypothetical protein